MHKLLFVLLALAAPAASGPTVVWKASLNPVQGDEYQLVLSGDVADGWYTHPLTDEYSAPYLTLSEGVELVGDLKEECELSDYKGSIVVEGHYVLKQNIKLSSAAAPVTGTVTWQSCTGDECSMPEDWEFTVGPAVVDTAKEGAGGSSKGLLGLIIEAILWGFAMLLTPCVFPMVPMTVSFFLKGSENKAQGRAGASLYGLFIVLLYTLPICVIIGLTWLLGGESVTADIFNWLSTHWLPNILFFIVFMVFAASFFGAFEITLPSSWVNSSDRRSSGKGIGGIFFLALTLVLVSFSCTGPIVGTVLIKSTGGEFWTPMLTMLCFSVAFALPFTVLALAPSLLKNLPKSGGWLNSVKVVLGFVEVALGFKFLSTADQTYHWHLLDREVYLAIWIVCFTLLGFYLLGKLRFKNDSPVEYVSVKRLALSIAVFSFVVYLVPGMWGAPLKALSGYLPPLETQDFVIGKYAHQEPAAQEMETDHMIEMPHSLMAYDNIEDALEEASRTGKRVFVDLTGHGCVNCREMEARVWSDPEVLALLRDRFVIAALYMDDKTRLPESKWVVIDSGKVLKDVGRVNSHIAATRFGVNAQPNYALLSSDGQLISPVRGYDLSVPGFVEFLKSAL